MKTTKFLSAALLIMVAQLFCGCSSVKATEEAGNASTFSVTSSEIITKELDLKDFHGFDISSYVEIYYTQGSSYKVEAKARAKAFEGNEIKVSDGLLVVKPLKGKRYMAKLDGQIRLYITSPSFDTLKNSGSCYIYADKVDVDDVRINNSGSFGLEFKDLVCKDLSMDNSGMMTFRCNIEASSVDVKNSGMLSDFSDVKTVKYTMNNSGMHSSERNYNISGDMKLTISGLEKFTGKIRAQNIDLNVSGMMQGDMDLEAPQLVLNISGRSELSARFKGDTADIRCSGSGSLDMDVDCKKLKSVSGGVAEIVIRGIAEDTSIEGTGVSRVDTRGLNNF